MKEQLAYAAGLIDGEGTVTMSRRGDFRFPVVSVSSTTIELLEFMKRNHGGSISKHKTYQDHHKQSWSWKVVNDAALALLKQIRPYMLEPEKTYRADCLTEEYKAVTVRNGKYTPEQRARRLEFEERFFHPTTT
jgi:hypothetical protein